MPYRFLPHTADLRVTIESGSFDELIADGVLLMRELLAGAAPVDPRETRPISAAGPDADETVHSFLREILYLHATDGFLPSTFFPDVVSPEGVRGQLAGERADPARHPSQPEVKAVTRHGFIVRRTERGWHSEIVFDL